MKSKMLLAVVGVALFASCQKDPLKNLSPSESRIYITNRDENVDFNSFKTYNISDSVGVIEDNQLLGKDLTEFDATTIAKLKQALDARGYTMVDRNSSPDLGITVSRIYSTSTGIISYPGYWDSYGSFYDPFYWGYGGYSYYDPIYYGPNYYATYSVTQGALSVDMLNLKDAAADNTIRPVWSALARGTGVFNSSAAEAEINTFFEQSPYIGTNQ
ncbi:MAG: DUF4136 domain-containing protein [Chitinophagaceae bacterium]|nr:DUF4136 domain-containing protein [Chitinophagaceae bacterium]